MAHVRAATDTPANRSNCHPFSYENYLFMHNGQIDGYLKIKRKLEALLPDNYYQNRIGSTDSEILFLYLVYLMETLSFSAAVAKVIRDVVSIMRDNEIGGPFRYTCALANGQWLYTAKYASDKFVPSLFYKNIEHGVVVVSEPLSDDLSNWHSVPDNHITLINNADATPTIHPIAN